MDFFDNLTTWQIMILWAIAIICLCCLISAWTNYRATKDYTKKYTDEYHNGITENPVYLRNTSDEDHLPTVYHLNNGSSIGEEDREKEWQGMKDALTQLKQEERLKRKQDKIPNLKYTENPYDPNYPNYPDIN